MVWAEAPEAPSLCFCFDELFAFGFVVFLPPPAGGFAPALPTLPSLALPEAPPAPDLEEPRGISDTGLPIASRVGHARERTERPWRRGRFCQNAPTKIYSRLKSSAGGFRDASNPLGVISFTRGPPSRDNDCCQACVPTSRACWSRLSRSRCAPLAMRFTCRASRHRITKGMTS